MAGPRLTDSERERIATLLLDGKSYGSIAKETGRSVGAISRVAKSLGHTASGSAAARTEKAREARKAFSAERRAEQMEELSAEFDRLVADMRTETRVFNFGGKNNTYREHKLTEPPNEAKRALMQSARDAMRTMLDVDRHDNKADDGASAVDAWLRDIVGEAVG